MRIPNLQCCECRDSFGTLKELHFHVARKHKMKIEKYYRTWNPKYDLQTGQPILFKSYEFYMDSPFNTRETMMLYFKENDENRKELCLKLLKDYQDNKGITFAPSTVESRLSLLPSPAMCQHYGFSYNELCESVGMSPQYQYNSPAVFDDTSIIKEVIVDSREQKPVSFSCKSITSKLDFGDYACREPYRKIFIERKSLIDLCGTMSAGYERFQKEVGRAKTMDAKLVVCVESPITSLAEIGKTPETKRVKASGEFIAHRVKELVRHNRHVQFVFVRNRSELPFVMERIFLLKSVFIETDLQYEYDYKRLTASFSVKPL